MNYSLDQFLAEAKLQIDYHNNNISHYNTIISEGIFKTKKLEDQIMDVMVQVVDIVVPNFELQEFLTLSKLIHKNNLVLICHGLKNETNVLKTRQSQIESDSQYINREIYLHPNTGEYTVEYKLASEAADLALQNFAPFKKYEAEFEDLIKDKYDTDEYEHTGILRFFNGEHLDNWRVGDILCEEFGFERFYPLREKYLEFKTIYQELKEASDHYFNKIKYIEDIVTEKKEIDEKLPQLPLIYKKKLAEEINSFLEITSPHSVNEFYKAYSGLSSMRITIEGLIAQHKYLDELRIKLVKEKEEIEIKKLKLQRESDMYNAKKYKFSNRQWPAEKFKKRFRRNSDFMNSRFKNYRTTQDKIFVFNNYSSSPAEGLLWWDLIMSQKNVKNDFSNEVKDRDESETHDDSNFESDTFDSGNAGSDNS